ncbi:transposase [Streptomyces sp. NPDC057249]|uniref:transposase n=1 Tax=Streptomyces sp. NPDC057249 TaxID=3346067 RepID=UPI00362E608C
MPLIPSQTPRWHRFPGRKPVDDRTASAGIVYVLGKGVSWEGVPAERIGCSGVTCWRRLPDCTEAGVCGPACMRRCSSRSTCRLAGHGRLIVDRHSTPLAASLTGGNRCDVTQLIPLLDAIPRIRGCCGRLRHKSKCLCVDRGYGIRKRCRLLWVPGYRPRDRPTWRLTWRRPGHDT